MIKPKKSLGQNFLKDKNIINKILNSIKITNENIIEIGPGLGALTKEIIKFKPNKFIIIEKDDLLYKNLLSDFASENIKIINQDALKFNFSELSNFKIISNLPYNISSKFLLKTLKLNFNINEILCMIQSEMAEKFNYKTNKMNKYRFLSKYSSKYEILFNVSKKVFFPRPKVESKVVKFTLKNKIINYDNLDLFIKLFFINKRKKITSNIKFKRFIDEKDYNKRYEDLEYLDILKIYQRFNLSIS